MEIGPSDGIAGRSPAQGWARLLAEVPELVDTGLAPMQKRLLALALVLQRASAWARSLEFAAALETIENSRISAGTRFVVSAVRVAVAAGAGVLACGPPRRDVTESAGRKARFSLPGSAGGRAVAGPFSRTRSRFPRPTIHAACAHEARNGASLRVPESAAMPEIRPVGVRAPAPEEVAIRDDLGEELQASGGKAWSHILASVGRGGKPITMPSIRTEFGGIFYLLNVAIALDLYGDFTQPRRPGIALSPWDLLSLIGRAWFGRPFERDPVWALLAQLSGRLPNEAPGTGFAPGESWAVPAGWLAPWDRPACLEVHVGRRRKSGMRPGSS